jgi:hypothetical protein
MPKNGKNGGKLRRAYAKKPSVVMQLVAFLQESNIPVNVQLTMNVFL